MWMKGDINLIHVLYEFLPQTHAVLQSNTWPKQNIVPMLSDPSDCDFDIFLDNITVDNLCSLSFYFNIILFHSTSFTSNVFSK